MECFSTSPANWKRLNSSLPSHNAAATFLGITLDAREKASSEEQCQGFMSLRASVAGGLLVLGHGTMAFKTVPLYFYFALDFITL